MTDKPTAAEILFGDTSPPPRTDNRPAMPEDPKAAILFPDQAKVQRNQAEQSRNRPLAPEEEHARRMFPVDEPTDETEPAPQPRAREPEAADDDAPRAQDGLEADPVVQSEYTALVEQLDLPSDKAQQLFNEMMPVVREQGRQQIEALHNEWIEATQSDPEIGGDQLDESVTAAKSFLLEHGTPELNQLLDQTGLGNNAEVIRVFARAARTLGL